ncbi:DUF6801 domain-containing protein [Streptomyces albus]|uniref:DUF6801 domain-containing protein n=1 Tax=Streptomyces albus TaxID=1888 RepID=UPI0033EE038F
MRPSLRARRRTARGAAVGVLAVVAGVLPGTGSQARENAVRADIAYTCASGESTRQLDATVFARFPAHGTPGEPLRIEELRLDVTLTREALAGLLPEGTTSLTSRAGLTVRVAQGGTAADAAWDDLAADETQIPATGGLTLAHRGTAPPVTVAHEGKVAFTAGALTLDLAPRPASSAPPGQDGQAGGPAAQQAPAQVSCRPSDGEEALLATVPVGDPGGEPGSPSATPGSPGSPAPSASGGGSDDEEDGPRQKKSAIDVGDAELPPAEPCETERPTGELDRSKLPAPPEGIPVKVNPTGGVHWCAVAVGVSNVRKLGGAMVVNDPRDGATTVNLLTQKEWAVGPGYNQTRHLGEIDLPDSTATFLDFDFMPVTARISFETSPMTIVAVQRGSGSPNYTTVHMNLSLRMHDVKVNGEPLDVGPACRTERPIAVELKGKQPEYEVLKGGVLRAQLDIPPFTGCGTGGEDLNPLFTASISGKGNYLKLVQSQPCNMRPNLGCAAPPKVPELPE